MIKIGGYILSYKDAVSWARRRYPNLDIYDEDVIPNIIEDHLESAKDLKVNCTVYIGEDRTLFCVFVTHIMDDPYATRTRFTPFPLDDHAVLLRQKLFPLKEDSDKLAFVTICDPSDKGY
ncbi:hypothetical protein J132_10504 [Termitomyces sp. J132]|nr:hypothetical protein H2248_006857 [Termitomyces sp. 'cryptogamus']KNZ76394.1 hypothetical protein J132_10504 [Termitomyces sp. J132]